MYKANPASVPRSERIVRRATCAPGDSLGQAVRVTLPRSGNLWRVGGVTSSTLTVATPAVGVIIKKLSPTVCFVQFHGTAPFTVYSGLQPGRVYVVGTDGKPAAPGDGNYPPIGGTDAFQQIGVATSDDELFIQPLSATEAAPSPSGVRLYRQALAGVVNGANTSFTTALKFEASGPSREAVYYNGVQLEAGAGNDYTAAESGGPSTGFDTINFIFAPKVGDKVWIDFEPTS